MTIESATKRHETIMVDTLKLADIINRRPFISHPSYPLKPLFKIDLRLQNSCLTY